MPGSGIAALCTLRNIPKQYSLKIISVFLTLILTMTSTYMYLHKPIQTGKSVTLSLARPGAEPRRVHPCQENKTVNLTKPCKCERKTRKPAKVSTSCDGHIIQDIKCLDQYKFQERLIMEKKFVPPAALRQQARRREQQETKRIVVIDKRFADHVGLKKDAFSLLHCLVSQCEFTGDTSTASLETADAVLFRHIFDKPVFKRPKDQVWAMFLLESPYASADLTQFNNLINYTATYRTGSTIYNPYGLYRPYSARNPKPNINLSAINYASGKTKKVAIMLSNCGMFVRNDRLKYVDELKKHIPVDIFGGCGPNKCPMTSMAECLQMLTRDYKFYLSFENANCREYITEKAFRNAWSYNMLPIVMGAHPDDYKKVAPPHSYIHVDEFDSPKALAEYLHKLDKSDKLYNEYFKWKEVGYVDPNENFDFYCRFCALLWAERNRTWVSDLNAWWRREGTCVGPGKWAKRTNLHLEDDRRVYQKYAPYP